MMTLLSMLTLNIFYTQGVWQPLLSWKVKQGKTNRAAGVYTFLVILTFLAS